MEYTQDQLATFKQSFALKRLRQTVMGGLTIVAFLGLVLLQRTGIAPTVPVGVVWVLGVIGVFLFSWQNWRCPACDRYLGKYVHAVCPRCGVALR
jgi:hypothetical protein